MKRLRDAEKMAEVKTKMEEAKLTEEEYDMSVAPGMKVQELHGDEEEQPGEGEEVSASTKRVPERKTKAQRNRAARLLAEVSLRPPYSSPFLTSFYRIGLLLRKHNGSGYWLQSTKPKPFEKPMHKPCLNRRGSVRPSCNF
jgi:hypothetical protein